MRAVMVTETMVLEWLRDGCGVTEKFWDTRAILSAMMLHLGDYAHPRDDSATAMDIALDNLYAIAVENGKLPDWDELCDRHAYLDKGMNR